MGVLDSLLNDGSSRRDFEDFVGRYDDGPPSEGYTDGEVLSRYGAVAHEVSGDTYQAAAHDALDRIPEADRRELADLLQQGAGQRGIDPSALRMEAGADLGDSGTLAGLLRSLHEQPGLLRDLLGGAVGGGGGLGGNLGPQTEADEPAGASGLGGLLASPAAKAALAGITAMLVRRMLQPRA